MRTARHWRPSPVILVVGAITIVMGAAVAVAAIPDEDGLIHSCYKNTTGAVRVIDSEAGQTCKGGETALNWNQQTATYVRTAAGFLTISAVCDAGDPATGGGVRAVNPPPSAVKESKPEFQFGAQPTGWFGALTDNGPIEVFVVCADVTL